jgi:hypothetical protein
MRSFYLFLLVAVSQTGSAGPRRRSLGDQDLGIFSLDGDPTATSWLHDPGMEYTDNYGTVADDYGLDYGLDYGPVPDGYGPDLPIFDTHATGSSDTGTYTDYTLALGESDSDFSLPNWDSDVEIPEILDGNSPSSPELFGFDYVSESGCSSDTTAFGKFRRDGTMCLDRSDIKPPTEPAPQIPYTQPPGPPPLGPKEDPPWLIWHEKLPPAIPNDIRDPRFDNPVETPEAITPSTDIPGPCPPRFTYVCCELGGSPPPIMLINSPIERCVKGTFFSLIFCLFPISSLMLRMRTDPEAFNESMTCMCCSYFNVC